MLPKLQTSPRTSGRTSGPRNVAVTDVVLSVVFVQILRRVLDKLCEFLVPHFRTDWKRFVGGEAIDVGVVKRFSLLRYGQWTSGPAVAKGEDDLPLQSQNNRSAGIR